MKVFLLIPITLSLMGIFIDCEPGRGKEPKKVKFDDKITIMWNSFNADRDEYPIVHMSEKDFQLNVHQKSELYKESSIEKNFIRTIADVIQCNYRMYETLYRHVKSLSGDDTDIYQYEKEAQPGDGSVDCVFPQTDEFDKIIGNKKSMQRKLMNLFNSIEPSYKMNEYLLQMMETMDADTKIDSELYKQMVTEAEKVAQIHDSFGRVFYNQEAYEKILKESKNGGEMKGSLGELLKKNPDDDYRISLARLRKRTHLLDEIVVTMEDIKVNFLCPKYEANMKQFKKDLTKALKIDFKELYVSTNRFHSIVVKALKADEGA